MKKLGILAAVFAGLFLLFAVSGGILVATGSVQFVEFAEGKLAERGIDSWDDLFELGNYFDEIGDGEDYESVAIDSSCAVGESVKEIIIEGVAADIEIFEGEDDELHLSWSYRSKNPLDSDAIDNQPAFDYVIDEESITVKSTGNSSVNIFGFVVTGSCKLTVLLPKGYEGSLTVRSAAADVDIIDLTLDRLTFTDCLGDIDVREITASFLNVERCLGDFDFDGDIDGFVIRNVTGDIELTDRAEITEDSELKANLGDISVRLAGSVNVERNGNTGEIHVSGSEKTADVTLALNNNLGDIRVNIGE